MVSATPTAAKEVAVNWPTVRHVEARSVLALIGGDDDDDLPDTDETVRAHYIALREAAKLSEAVAFLGHALQRFETVAWAARLLEERPDPGALNRRRRAALDTALRWVGEPTEAHRQAAYRAANASNKPGPERSLALAVFYTGGSVSPPGTPPIHAPAHSCALFATGAIVEAAYASDDTKAFFARALALGEAIAENGLVALERT